MERQSNAVVMRSALVLALTACATGAVAADWESPVRTVLVLAFLLFAPGLALTEALGVTNPLHQLALATSASLAIETIAALGLLYAGEFGPERAMGVVVAFTVVAAPVPLLRRRQS